MQSKTLSSRFISGLQPKFLWNTKKNHKEILQSIMVLIKIFQIIQLPFQHERKKHTSIQNKTVKWKPNCNELWDKCHGTWFILTWFYNAGSLCLNLPVKSTNSITMNNELWYKCHRTWSILTWFYNAGSLCLNSPSQIKQLNGNELWDKCHGTWSILTWFYNARSLLLNSPCQIKQLNGNELWEIKQRNENALWKKCHRTWSKLTWFYNAGFLCLNSPS